MEIRTQLSQAGLKALKKEIVGMQTDRSVIHPDTDTELPYNAAAALISSQAVLQRLNGIYNLMELHLEPVSERKLMGKPLNLVKRLMARWLRWLYLPVMGRQSEINALMLQELMMLQQQIDEIKAREEALQDAP